MSKIPCEKCGTLILPDTAQRTGGLCMPCKSGTREQIEAGKKYHIQQSELEKTCPFRALRRRLDAKVFSEGGGFPTLSGSEKLYWVVNVLEGEVYNGGFDQYFWNSSGAHYLLTLEGLNTLGAGRSLSLLQEAKRTLFGKGRVPEDTAERRDLLRALFPERMPEALNSLDKAYWENPDDLGGKLERFAVQEGLLAQQAVEGGGTIFGGTAPEFALGLSGDSHASQQRNQLRRGE